MKKLKVSSNLAISIDGKIADQKRNHFLLGTKADHEQMRIIRKQNEAILVGGETIRTYKKPMLVAKARTQPVNILLTRKLEGFSLNWPYFKNRTTLKVIFHTEKISKQTQDRFSKQCTLIQLNSKLSIAKQIVQHLQGMGIKSLLVEGGGGVMWDFARENLIDEYHLTITPWIIGGTESPTLVDGKGFIAPDFLKLKLKKHWFKEGQIFAVYVKD